MPHPRRKRWLLAGAAAGVAATLALVVGLGLLAASGAAAGSPPVNTSPPTISGTVQVGGKLHADPGSWTGSPPISFHYRWQRCDQNGANCADIGGATSDSYTLTSADVGNTVRVVVEATNADGTGTAASAPTAVVAAPAAPSNTNPPFVTGTPLLGQTLTANPGTWTGPGTITFSFQWRRCDRFGGACTDIPGASAGTYVVVSADVGHTLRVRVTATNASGSTTATSAPTAVVASGLGGCPPGTQPVPVADVTPPARLTVDRMQFSPPVVGRTTTSVSARFHVSDTCGQSVQGALVYATAVPFNQLSVPPEGATDANGWATLDFQTLAGFPATRFQRLLVVFVRARKPGEDLLTGISTRRLVSVRVDLSR
ncbi:MAG TPA: hypothetical protein VFA44_16120 [Gaiellaceae bacterium]|nr:hypothetical protein [Gaiellaceae bacterium]